MNDRVMRVLELIKALPLARGDDHGLVHFQRVLANAVRLAQSLPADSYDMEVVQLAALLHDLEDHKFNDVRPGTTRQLLAQAGVTPTRIEQVLAIVGEMSWSKRDPARSYSLESQLVQDADRLEAIGAAGIARCFVFGAQHGRGFEDSIAHFHEKLLLIAAAMHTPAGKQEAQRRHETMLRFLQEWQRELDWPATPL